MIIGFEAKRLYQNLSGLGNYSRNTVNLLARYYPENRYVLFVPRLSDLFTPPPSVDVISPFSWFSKKFGTFWRIFKVSGLLKKSKIDVFHGLSHVLPIGLKRTGIPSVVTIHDLIYLRYPEFYSRIDRRLYLFHTSTGCKKATKILAISDQTKNDLINLLGVDPGKIEVIHQSCNNAFYERVSEEQKAIVREKFNLPEKFILCVGTIEARKNQLSILQGVAHVNLDIQIVIVGKPTPYKRILDEYILEAGLRKQLTFLHDTDTSDLQAIYQMAEIMVYPSFYEGFGLPVLEAQASGCPVITSNISSLPEAGGDGALYISPGNSTEIGNAIANILNNNELREELIRKGTKNALLFGDQIVADKLTKLYQSILGN
jgi:glycosyltransferase involved in cell wall biosynthesis